jgi:putative aldouronate transport system substrate-binding protein
MKKLIALLALVSIFASACATSQTPTSTAAKAEAPQKTETPATQAPAAETAQPKEEAPTLVWWLIGNQPPNLTEGISALNEHTEASIGVKIDIKVAGWGEWSDKINQIVNSGESFDIMFTNNTKYNMQVSLGAFEDITDLVQAEAPELYKFIPQKVWDGTKIKGRIYAVPTYKDSSMTQYWVFDHSFVEKCGLDISKIKNFADLDQPLRAMKDGEPSSFYPLVLGQADGFNGILNYYDDLTMGLPPIGVRVDDSERKVVSVLEQTDVQESLGWLHKWYQDGIINQDAPTLQELPKYKPFFSGQGFPGAEIGWASEYGVERYDTVQVFGPLYTTATIQGSLNAISSNSKHKAEALKYLEAVNNDHKLRDMLAFGVPGKDFEYKSENVVKRLTDTWGIGNYAIGTFFVMSTQEGAQEDMWEQVRALNEKAQSSVCLGFAFDMAGYETEVANCNATWNKYKYELLTGASEPEEKIPAIIADLKSAGMDKLIEAAQSQIDAFF